MRAATPLVYFIIAACCLTVLSQSVRADDTRESNVGMSARIDQLILPGAEIEAKPIEDRRTPIVVRIVEVFAHGDSYRYDLEYYGLEPGKFDLRDSLQRKDGSSMDGVPAIEVSITPILGEGQVRPTELNSITAPYLGGYRNLWIVGGVIWLLGLLAILFVGRTRSGEDQREAQKPKTLAERLRPSVEKAIAGELDPGELAELERLLLTFWRRRLNLDQVDASEAIVALRAHEEAGPMVNQLERWLHHPDGGGDVDVAELLQPYQDLPPDALD